MPKKPNQKNTKKTQQYSSQKSQEEEGFGWKYKSSQASITCLQIQPQICWTFLWCRHPTVQWCLAEERDTSIQWSHLILTWSWCAYPLLTATYTQLHDCKSISIKKASHHWVPTLWPPHAVLNILLSPTEWETYKEEAPSTDCIDQQGCWRGYIICASRVRAWFNHCICL